MVIFHSYVSLPEGKMMGNLPNPQTSRSQQSVENSRPMGRTKNFAHTGRAPPVRSGFCWYITNIPGIYGGYSEVSDQ